VYTYFYDGNNYSWVQLWIVIVSIIEIFAFVTFK
jgi:hypothetical protein